MYKFAHSNNNSKYSNVKIEILLKSTEKKKICLVCHFKYTFLNTLKINLFIMFYYYYSISVQLFCICSRNPNNKKKIISAVMWK